MPRAKQTTQVTVQHSDHTTADRNANFQTLAKEAEAQADWKTAARWYSLAMEQRLAELALINQVQEGLSSRLEMHAIYDLVGDSLRDRLTPRW